MKTIETTVYNFDELSENAKEIAIREWYENEEYPFLPEDLMERFYQLAGDYKLQYDDIKMYYALSYCQGDGLCFIGKISKNGKSLQLSHNYRYYFANSVTMEFYDDETGEEVEEVDELKDLYFKICGKLEKYGYSILEYRMNNEEFLELCEANEYTFLSNGKMKNY